jgi:P-type Ca2+ transporter type 2C
MAGHRTREWRLGVFIQFQLELHSNIHQALEFVITTNISEIVVSLVEALHGANELETPMELLWVKGMTDVLPRLGSALADSDPEVVAVPPRPPG